MSILNNKKIIIAVSIIVVILVILVSIAAIIYTKGNSAYSDAYIHDKNAVKKIIENMNSQKERMAGFYSIDYARGSTLVLHNELYLMIVQRESGILQTSAVVDLKKIGCSYMQGSKYTTFKVSENAQYVCIQNKDSESSNAYPLYLLDTENETFDRYENGIIPSNLLLQLDADKQTLPDKSKTIIEQRGELKELQIRDNTSGVILNLSVETGYYDEFFFMDNQTIVKISKVKQNSLYGDYSICFYDIYSGTVEMKHIE